MKKKINLGSVVLTSLACLPLMSNFCCRDIKTKDSSLNADVERLKNEFEEIKQKLQEETESSEKLKKNYLNKDNNDPFVKKSDLIDYPTRSEILSKSELLKCLKYDDSGNVSFNYNGNKVFIAENGTVVGGGAKLDYQGLQDILDNAKGVNSSEAEKTAVLNFFESTTFGGKTILEIISEALLDSSTTFGTDSSTGLTNNTGTLDAIIDARAKKILKDATTRYGFMNGTTAEEDTLTNAIYQLAEIKAEEKIKEMMGDAKATGAAKKGTHAGHLNGDTYIDLKSKKTTLKKFVDYTFDEFEELKYFKLFQKIDLGWQATSHTKSDLKLLHNTIIKIVGDDESKIKQALKNIHNGSYIGYCEAAGTIGNNDDARDVIHNIYNNTEENKVFIYKNTTRKTSGIYKITTALKSGDNTGRCVAMKTDGKWAPGYIQLGATV